jgi:glucose/arabinose dehydrogenase
MQAHSALLQNRVYQGDDFPADYKRSAFVTLHGSWNRSLRTGYYAVMTKRREASPAPVDAGAVQPGSMPSAAAMP